PEDGSSLPSGRYRCSKRPRAPPPIGGGASTDPRCPLRIGDDQLHYQCTTETGECLSSKGFFPQRHDTRGKCFALTRVALRIFQRARLGIEPIPKFARARGSLDANFGIKGTLGRRLIIRRIVAGKFPAV